MPLSRVPVPAIIAGTGIWESWAGGGKYETFAKLLLSSVCRLFYASSHLAGGRCGAVPESKAGWQTGINGRPYLAIGDETMVAEPGQAVR